MNVQVLAKFSLLQALDSTQYKLLLLSLHHQTPSVGEKKLSKQCSQDVVGLWVVKYNFLLSVLKNVRHPW